MIKRSIIASPSGYEKGSCNLAGRCLVSLLLFCLTGLLPLTAAQANPERELRTHERQLSTLKKRVGEIDAELERDKQLHNRESSKLRETEQEIAGRLATLRSISKQLDRQATETRRLQQQQEKATAALSRQRGLLAGQLRASYINGRQEKVKLLLNQGNPAIIGRVMGYHDYLARARSEQIEAVGKQTLVLVELESELNMQLQALQTLQEIQQGQLAQLETARAERGSRVAKLEAEIAESGQNLQRMQSEQSALQKLVNSIRKQLSDIPAQFRNSRPLSQAEGNLPWPLEGQLLASYGQKKNGTSLQWNGIWIAAKSGTPVRAVAVGRVVYVSWLHRYGLLVITEHSDGYYSLYGHNQEARVEVGDSVKAGQIIAYAGDSGGHSRSGLYFELRKGKDPVNPIRWLVRR